MTYINDPETLQAAKSGDETALDTIIRTNLGLVKSLALRHLGRGAELEDLIQIGLIGMIKAVRGFDPEKNCRFTTYAVPLIAGEIKRFLRDDGWIKISREAKQNAARILRFSEEYEKKHGAAPGTGEIAAGLGLTEEEIVFALDASRPQLSLYEKDEETGFSPENAVGEDPFEREIDRLALREAVARLAEPERLLLRLRYEKSLTQEQTARFLGWTQVKVSREEKKILAKLRERFLPGA